MKKFNYFIFIFFLPSILFGQKVKKINDKENGEVYYVLKAKPEIKHGKYIRKKKNNLFLDGYYKNGIKDSIWTAYDFNGKESIKYNFTTEKIIYVSGNYFIPSPDSILSRPALYVGNIMGEIVYTLRYPRIAIENQISGKLEVSFTVNKFGKPSNFYVKNKLGYGLDEEAIRIIKLLPEMWIPALNKMGDAVDSIFTIPIKFLLN